MNFRNSGIFTQKAFRTKYLALESFWKQFLAEIEFLEIKNDCNLISKLKNLMR
jgi:hypothetical protein